MGFDFSVLSLWLHHEPLFQSIIFISTKLYSKSCENCVGLNGSKSRISYTSFIAIKQVVTFNTLILSHGDACLQSKESYNDIHSNPGSKPIYRAKGNLKMFTPDIYIVFTLGIQNSLF